MKIEPGVPVPSPDTVYFDETDYNDLLVLCSTCLTASFSSSTGMRVAHGRQLGLSVEMLGKKIVLPRGHSLLWVEGAEIPAGGDYITELTRIFGRSMYLTEASGAPFPLFADTIKNGNACCAWCMRLV